MDFLPLCHFHSFKFFLYLIILRNKDQIRIIQICEGYHEFFAVKSSVKEDEFDRLDRRLNKRKAKSDFFYHIMPKINWNRD